MIFQQLCVWWSLAVAQTVEHAAPADVSLALVEEESAGFHVSCGKNKYYWGIWTHAEGGNGQRICVKCPLGSRSNGCKRCQPDKTGASCHKTTEDCPKGKFFSKKLTICVDCPAGYWQTEFGSDKCYPCPEGSFQPNSASTACYSCEIGQFTQITGSSACHECDLCPSGKFGTTAREGTTNSTACACHACAPGKFAPAGYTSCFKCGRGQYQPHKGGKTCRRCKQGRFQSVRGQSSCHACRKGELTKRLGSKSGEDCEAPLVCPAGMLYSSRVVGLGEVGGGRVQKSCDFCPAGTYGVKTLGRQDKEGNS